MTPAFCLLKYMPTINVISATHFIKYIYIYILGQDDVFIRLHHFSLKENGAWIGWMEGVSRLHHAL